MQTENWAPGSDMERCRKELREKAVIFAPKNRQIRAQRRFHWRSPLQRQLILGGSERRRGFKAGAGETIGIAKSSGMWQKAACERRYSSMAVFELGTPSPSLPHSGPLHPPAPQLQMLPWERQVELSLSCRSPIPLKLPLYPRVWAHCI